MRTAAGRRTNRPPCGGVGVDAAQEAGQSRIVIARNSWVKLAKMRLRSDRGTAIVLAALALGLILPALASAEPKTAAVGSTFVVTGRTGSPTSSAPSTGLVVARGRWDTGRWRTLTSTRTDANGRYRLTILLWRRGLLTLTVIPPDGRSHSFMLRVV